MGGGLGILGITYNKGQQLEVQKNTREAENECTNLFFPNPLFWSRKWRRRMLRNHWHSSRHLGHLRDGTRRRLGFTLLLSGHDRGDLRLCVAINLGLVGKLMRRHQLQRPSEENAAENQRKKAKIKKSHLRQTSFPLIPRL